MRKYTRKFKKLKKARSALSVAVASALASYAGLSHAEDVEVYYPDGNAKPNVLFVIDTSGSMDGKDGTGEERLDRLRGALNSVIGSVDDVNIGLMRFAHTDYAELRMPVYDLDSTALSGNGKTHRQELIRELATFTPSGWTPTMAGLMEAALYFGGKNVRRGVDTEDFYPGSLVNSTTRQYNAPSFEGCGLSNYIVILTDGQPMPENSNETDDEIPSLIQKGSACSDFASNVTDTNGKKFGSRLKCAPELAQALAHTNYTSFTDQPVHLFTVGFGVGGGDGWLEDLAEYGLHPSLETGDNFFSLGGGSSKEQLASTLTDILNTISELDVKTVTQPVPASNFQGIANNGDLYLGVFGVKAGELWPGNVHKFTLGADAVIRGKDGEGAVDDETGFFKQSAIGHWTDDVAQDGGSPELGGAKENLPEANARKLYTYVGSSPSEPTGLSDFEFKKANVKTASNTSGFLTEALFGANDSSEVEALVEWIREGDSNGNGQLFDPLHTAVHTVTYDNADADDTTYVIYGDNGGALRVLSAKTGEEKWSFMPQELLVNLGVIRSDATGVRTKYGVDGPISVWVSDTAGDGVVDVDDDKVMVYFGLRRGGNAVYALDITDIDNPKMVWFKTSEDTGFERLGQTWSRMVQTQVLIGENVTPVVMFTGGYDSVKDDQTIRTPDDAEENSGNSLYMVNSLTGELIWSASKSNTFGNHTETFSKMNYSIPGGLRVIDVDDDRFNIADRFYFGDAGGQLWRCTITAGAAVSDLINDCTVMFTASGSSAENDRRFMETPDVSKVTLDDGTPKLAVAIGTGNRANLKDTGVDSGLRDFFYVVHDSAERDGAAPTNLLPNNLYNASGTNFYSTLSAEDKDDVKDEYSNGWRLRLDAGEKVVSSASTHEGITYFSTFTYTSNVDSCVAGSGEARLYSVDKSNGMPAVYGGESGNDAPKKTDRYAVLKTTAIPASPSIFRVADEDGILAVKGAQICVGIECTLVSGDRVTTPGHHDNLQ